MEAIPDQQSLPPSPNPTPPGSLKERVKARLDKAQQWREAHPVKEAAWSFLAGFLYDVATLDRIDSALSIVQHTAWLLVLGSLLVITERHPPGSPPPPGWMGKFMPYSETVLHFLFGGLLSSFALFFFISASGGTSLVFAAFMFLLLISNELPHVRRLGPSIRFALYAFCLVSYFGYVLPILAGFLSVWLFLGSVALAFGVLYLLFRLSVAVRTDVRRAVLTTLLPGSLVLLGITGLYVVQAIPPVPLSVQYMGIYHGMERDGGAYRLQTERPAWRIWEHGDQVFRAREGDTVHVFTRIFAPRGFKDAVSLRWMVKDAKGNWMTSDVIPLTVVGGRGQGFRGHAFKHNWRPGEWRVQVETDDGRPVGHIGFVITEDPRTGERSFHEDVM